MFTVEDTDLPITVASKIISGSKPTRISKELRSVAKLISGDEQAGEKCDMFSISEIREIANYLFVYCESHKEGD